MYQANIIYKGDGKMSYTKLVKQWGKDHDKRIKQEQIYMREQRERTEQINAKIIMSQIMGRIKEQEKKNTNSIIKDKILESLRTKSPFTYPQYLIIWDFMNSDYNQIMHDLNKGKINIDDVKSSIDYIDKFSNTLIDEYWKGALLSA